MIIRILSEGQFEVDQALTTKLNEYDKQVEAALATDDQTALTRALTELHDAVINQAAPVADDSLVESDLVLPPADATVAQVRALFDEQPDGLIPG